MKQKTIYSKTKNIKSAIAIHWYCWEMNHIFDFNSTKIISKATSMLELNFLEAFNIYKIHKIIVNFDFAIHHCQIVRNNI